MAEYRYPEYTAVIRTLGKAGEKFEAEINSLKAQTLQPRQILAYIPDGYDIPVFPGSDAVRWIRSPKGMVTQRSLPFDEVETEYILFLDDDVYLPPAGAEMLMRTAVDENADAVVPNTFPNSEGSLKWKLRNMGQGAFPSFSKKWAFRIRHSTYYNYCDNPDPVMPTQSGAGPCSLVCFSTYKAIHFEEERWIELCGYPLGEDLLFFNKMYQCGYRVLAQFDTGIQHLDAGSGHAADHERQFRLAEAVRYILWHRISYSTATSGISRLYRSACYHSTQGAMWLLDLVRFAVTGKSYKMRNRFRGMRQGKEFTKSDEYRKLPRFNAYARTR